MSLHIVAIQEGLGHQMFQYAYALYLRQRLGAGHRVIIETGAYRTAPAHNGYELGRLFGIFPSSYSFWFEERLLMHYHLIRDLKAQQGIPFSFPPEIESPRPVVYHRGWWQSYRVLESIESALRATYRFRLDQLNGLHRLLHDEVRWCESVAIHVRMGDYFSNPEAHALLGEICDVDYYQRSIAWFRRRYGSAVRFYLFSDDPHSARDYIVDREVTFVASGSQEDNWQAMCVMSACRHQVIANSSFSFWAAWLNENPAKCVVAPRRWYRTEETHDITPLVSVVVIAYNASTTLRRSLDSVLNQTYVNWELVGVDDGSTDGTAALFAEYAALDSRVRFVSQSNGGTSVARQRGMEEVKGCFSLHLDSDDWLSDDAIEKAVDRLLEDPTVDIVLFDTYFVFNDRQSLYMPDPQVYDRLHQSGYDGETAFRLSLDWTIVGLYLRRTTIWQQEPYDSLNCTSDENTTRLNFLHARKVVGCRGIYYYWQNPQSVTKRCSLRQFDLLESMVSFRSSLLSRAVPDPIVRSWDSCRWLQFVDRYYYYLGHKSSFCNDERKVVELRLAQCYRTFDHLKFRLPIARFGFLRCFGSYPFFLLQAKCYLYLRNRYQRIKAYVKTCNFI